MRNKKVLLIVLIAVIVVLIIAIGGFAFAYATTDFLKSNEQLFSKYLGETGDKLENFESEKLGAYIAKKEEMPYESQGRLSVKVDMPGLDEEYLELLNGLNITFEGKTDKKNEKSQQDIKINYSDDIAFPISYKRTGDLYGIISDVVIKKYIAVQADETEELLKKLGVSEYIEEDALETIQLGNTSIDPEAITNSIERCKTILKENVTKANFSKPAKDTYTLTISDSKVVISILDELQNSGILTESLRDSLEGALSTQTFKVTVNKSNHVTLEIVDVIAIEIQVSDKQLIVIPQIPESEEKPTITVQKEETDNQLTYQINFDVVAEDENVSVSLGMEYSNLEGQTVRENYTLGLAVGVGEEVMGYDYTLTSSNKFVNKLEIESLTSEDALILNERTDEEVATVFAMLVSAIEQINTVQMQQLGLDPAENPLIYATPIGAIMLSNSLNGRTRTR